LNSQEGTNTSAPFNRILCGVEGDPASTEAARQAIALATPDTAVHFLAVYTTVRLPQHDREELQQSLDEAAQIAREAGFEASTEQVDGRHALDVLFPAGEHYDLLVLGSHNRSRASGLLLGSVAGKAAHETEHPLLIAREPPGPSKFPRTILFASDGSPGSWAPARATARIATAFNSRVEIVHVHDGSHPERESELEAQATEIREFTQEEPGLIRSSGHPTQAIIEAAQSKGSSLIVSGRRGLHGIRSLGSVSERVVHRAPCSVLLVPAGEDGPSDSKEP
jgi:nucleotide-binding universal stress UspA family protein